MYKRNDKDTVSQFLKSIGLELSNTVAPGRSIVRSSDPIAAGESQQLARIRKSELILNAGPLFSIDGTDSFFGDNILVTFKSIPKADMEALLAPYGLSLHSRFIGRTWLVSIPPAMGVPGCDLSVPWPYSFP